MNLLDSLKFVKGSVNANNLLPELTYFKIDQGRIYGANGIFSLSCPILLDISCKPKADIFAKLLHNCIEIPTFTLKDNGKLHIKSRNIKGSIDCITNEVPIIEPSGNKIDLSLKDDFIHILKKLYPYVSEDASRPWSMGMLFVRDKIYVTNNIILIEYSLDHDTNIIANIPKPTIKELIRINEIPLAAKLGNNISFMYSDDKIISSRLCDNGWPDVTKLLSFNMENPIAVKEDFFKCVEILRPFCDKVGRIYISQNEISTDKDFSNGISMSIENNINICCFNVDMLLSLSPVVTSIDFRNYPKPCYIFGDNFKGLLVGIKDS